MKNDRLGAIDTIAALNKLFSLLCSHFVVELIASAAAAEFATDVELIGDAIVATVSMIVSLMIALLFGLPIMFDGNGNCDRRSTSFAVETIGMCFLVGDLERIRLSRFDDLSLDVFGDDFVLSYDDFRGDLELSFGDVLDDLLLPPAFPGNKGEQKEFLFSYFVISRYTLFGLAKVKLTWRFTVVFSIFRTATRPRSTTAGSRRAARTF